VDKTSSFVIEGNDKWTPDWKSAKTIKRKFPGEDFHLILQKCLKSAAAFVRRRGSCGLVSTIREGGKRCENISSGGKFGSIGQGESPLIHADRLSEQDAICD
jgi:hypothetical protein